MHKLVSRNLLHIPAAGVSGPVNAGHCRSAIRRHALLRGAAPCKPCEALLWMCALPSFPQGLL